MRRKLWGWTITCGLLLLLLGACRQDPEGSVTPSPAAAVIGETPQAVLDEETPTPGDEPVTPQTPAGKPQKPVGEPAQATATAASPESVDESSEEWTVLLYMSVAQGLDAKAMALLEELEALDDVEQLTVVLQVDRQRPEGDSDEWSGARRYVLQANDGDGETELALLETMDATNMGDPQTLTDFIDWAQESYPAARQALVLWGNHQGWQGLAADADDEDDLSLADLEGALARVDVAEGVRLFDVIVLEGGATANVEILAAIQPYAQYAVASHGLPFAPPADANMLIEYLASLAGRSPRTFAQSLAAEEFERGNNAFSPVRHGYDLAQLPALQNAMRSLASLLIEQPEMAYVSMGSARYVAQFASLQSPVKSLDAGSIDVRTFVEYLAAHAPFAELAERADAVRAAVDDMIVESEGGEGVPEALGLSFMPDRQLEELGYGAVDSLEWLEALKAFYGAQDAWATITQGDVWVQAGTHVGVQQPALAGVEVRSTVADNARLAVWQRNEDESAALLGVMPLPADSAAQAVGDWPDGVSQFELTWDASAPYVSDGVNGDFVPLWPVTADAAFVAVPGVYQSADAEADGRESLLLMDVTDRSMVGIWLQGDAYTGGSLLELEAGDSFQMHRVVHNPDSGFSYEPGVTLAYTNGVNIEYDYFPLAGGDYQLGLLIDEPAGNVTTGNAGIVVNNEGLLPGYRTYVNATYGFQFLYPVSWPAPVFDGRRVSTAGSQRGPVLTVYVHPQLGSGSAGRLKVETLATFGDLDILYEEEIVVEDTAGTLTAYGYQAEDGPHTGVFMTLVDPANNTGYVIDLDGLTLEEQETIEAARRIAESWQFVSIRSGVWLEQWVTTELDGFSVSLPADYVHETLDNGWERFKAAASFLALRQHDVSGQPPAEIAGHWAGVAARGVEGFAADEPTQYALGPSLWAQVPFTYETGDGMVGGYILATVYGGRETVAWIESDAGQLEERMHAHFLPSLAGMLPTAPGTSGILFEDRFDDNGAWGVGRQDGASGTVAGNAYLLEVDAERGFFWTAAGATLSSGTYSVDVLQTDGTPNAAYGLLLGATREARTFTMLQISSDGFVWIGQCVQDCADAATLIGEGWFESEAIHTGVGAINNLRVRVDGVVMSFYINDTYIGEVESDEPISGDVGLAVETFGEGDVSVQFDNLRVTSP